MATIPTGRELLDPEKVVAEAGLRSGMVAADFGCGTLGHFVFPAAELVGSEGRVYAVDILKSVLEGVANRAKLLKAGNVEALWSDIERPGGIALSDGSVDVGFLINNLFLTDEKATMVRECVRTVRPGGTFVIVDWKPTGTGFGPMFAKRVGSVEVLRLAQDAGLEPIMEFEPGKFHYGLVFRKPGVR